MQTLSLALRRLLEEGWCTPWNNNTQISGGVREPYSKIIVENLSGNALDTNGKLIYVNEKQYKGILRHKQAKKMRQ